MNEIYCVRESYGIYTNLQLFSLRQAWSCWRELKQKKNKLTEAKCLERYVVVIDLIGLSLSQLLGQNIQHSSSRIDPPKQLLSRFLNITNYSDEIKENLIDRFKEFVDFYDGCRHFGPPKHEILNTLNYHKTELFVNLALEIWNRVINHFAPVPENDESFEIIKDILDQHLEVRQQTKCT